MSEQSHYAHRERGADGIVRGTCSCGFTTESATGGPVRAAMQAHLTQADSERKAERTAQRKATPGYDSSMFRTTPEGLPRPLHEMARTRDTPR